MALAAKTVLGVEGGGTKTAWVLVELGDSGSRVLHRGKLPAANFRLTPLERLRPLLEQLPPIAGSVGVFLAGCVTREDREKLAAICAAIWPGARIVTGSDRESGLAAALAGGDGIAVNAGTGSSITGRRGKRVEKAGGWGHILGDAGGGYYLSLQSLRIILREYDLHRGEQQFAADVLRALSLRDFDELVRWAQTADKMQIATLAPVVFQAAEQGDVAARQIIDAGARVLAEYTAAVAARLKFTTPDVVLLGSVMEGSSIYVAAFRRELAMMLPEARVRVTASAPEFGAVWLASDEEDRTAFAPTEEPKPARSLAATEERNLRSQFLDRLTAREFVELFIDEERCVETALRACADILADGIERIAAALRNGGRLFYVGAGTSGRLGVLDASEIPPTFGASPELIQGVIAGGVAALVRSAEGAEDNESEGAAAIAERGAKAGDVVCGIAASGSTPFVIGALERARVLGAATIFLTCNPARVSAKTPWDLEIDLPTGPELVTGSTRLKAGTATKVALNILSTGAMIALGKVRGNLMIDVVAGNEKLRDRAARIVAELSGCSHEAAVSRLEKTGGNVRAAIDLR